MKILLLEDDTALANILVDYLEDENEVIQTYGIKKVFSLCEKHKFDLYIFDINVPDGDGISLLKELRKLNDNTPTIFITAFHDTKYLKSAFESGANDFIKKPFDLEELGVRITNIKRQFAIESKISIEKTISFDIQTRIVQTSSKNYTMTYKESSFLQYLYQNRTRVVSSDELLQNIWEYDEMPSDDAVRTVIKNLRKYIGKEHILNVRGEGYKYE
ncbi:response regulator transcription factor [Sulfurimonas sp. SAG-AH-194-C21]|nr:response regulator transcription factor [Sulfurimonas sp. SAG-AH-194-C21]MDF1883106.1 response regulator transcription factor [Sulfurimonas sp. SAG-AH-194-C21]